ALLLWAQCLAGLRRDPNGPWPVLDAAGRARLVGELADRGPRPPAADPLAWHRRQAAACEADGRRGGAVWHLDPLLAAREGWRERPRRGQALADLGRLDAALADLAAAADLAGESWEVWDTRGRLHLRRGEWDETVADLTRALALRPGHAPARNARGFAHAA